MTTNANNATDTPLLVLRDVSVTYHTPDGSLPAADRVSFELGRQQTIAIVGESGSGKSTVGRAVLGLVDPALAMVSGSVVFDGQQVLVTSDLTVNMRCEREAANRRLRGDRAALIPQKLKTPANPVQRIGAQLVEQVLAHRPHTAASAARARVERLLRSVELDGRFDAYPHELSGGMCQRFWIAMALANDPKLIVADESTTALDVVRQREFMSLLMAHQREAGLGVLLISHDLALVEEFADHLIVLYSGRVVEVGPTEDVFRSPRHPYTAGLLETLLRMNEPKKTVFPVIRGELPKMTSLPTTGCHFAPRCPYAADRCGVETPDLLQDASGSRADRCLRKEEWTRNGRVDPTPSNVHDGRAHGEILHAEGVGMRFVTKRGLFAWGAGSNTVLEGLSLHIREGETVALIGKSGCGKSTLAKILAGLLTPTSGHVTVSGSVAMVFQDPGASLNPLRRIGDAVSGPIRWRGCSGRIASTRAVELLKEVGLPDAADRFPGSLSGGQQQRVAIARALAVEPSILILDEAVTALDCSIRGQILNLLREINRRRQLAYLFITHDLCVARHFADRTLVMREGTIEECVGSSEYQELLRVLPRYQREIGVVGS